MTFWRVLGLIALIPILWFMSSIAIVLGSRYYASHVFRHQRPAKALEDIFQEPEKIKVTQSEQWGFSLSKSNTQYFTEFYTEGDNAQLLPNIKEMSPKLREILSHPPNICVKLQIFPSKELKFYDGSHNGIEIMGVKHLPTHRYCFSYNAGSKEAR